MFVIEVMFNVVGDFVIMFCNLYQVVRELNDLPFKLLGLSFGVPVCLLPLFIFVIKSNMISYLYFASPSL